MNDVTNPLLFEMIRSFVMVAQELNLSRAVEKLKSTRQTVRRHIATLEEIKGVSLFRVVDRRYELTQAGEHALPQAQDIIARGHAWLRGQNIEINGLQQLSHREPNGWFFYQQQHPMRSAWKHESPLIRETLRAWAMSGGNIESEEMQHVRPFLIVYRPSALGWICIEFGEQSFFVRWFGKEKALSSVGQSLGRMPGGDEFARMLDQAFFDVDATHNPRLDHVYTMVPRGPEGAWQKVNYRRLMLSGSFPDGSSALFALVEPSIDIDIFGVDPAEFEPPAEDYIVQFDPATSKYGY